MKKPSVLKPQQGVLTVPLPSLQDNIKPWPPFNNKGNAEPAWKRRQSSHGKKGDRA